MLIWRKGGKVYSMNSVIYVPTELVLLNIGKEKFDISSQSIHTGGRFSKDILQFKCEKPTSLDVGWIAHNT